MKHIRSKGSFLRTINFSKYLCALSLMLSFLLAFFSPVYAVEPKNSSHELVILYTNDTHSSLFPFGTKDEHGGIARMSTLIKELRSENENVLALHAGDVFVGSFAFNKYLGYPSLKIMEDLYDAMALGNHEFDLSPDILAYVLSGYNPVTTETMGDPITLPLLSANLDLSSFPALQPFVQSSIIKEIGGMKIGLLGVVTNNPVYYSPLFVGMFLDPYMAAGAEAAALQLAGSDVVIAISHLGKDYDVMGLSLVPGIDIIVGGHSHDEFFASNINGKIIVQSGAFGKNLGELRVSVNTATDSVTLVNNMLHPINKKIRKDPALQEYLVQLLMGIYFDPRFGPVYCQRVAKAKWDHEEEWLPTDPYQEPPHKDTPLGNLIVDAIRSGVEKAGYPVDLALENNGYIGHKIYKKKVTANDILRAIPYGYDPMSGLGFKIKLVNLLGAEILAALEYTVSMTEYTDEFSIQASGLSFEYNSSVPSPGRVDMSSVLINGAPVNPFGTYTIAMNEALVGFLGTLGLDLTGRIIEPSPDLLEFNLVKDYMQQLKRLKYTSEGRIIDTAVMP